MKKELNKYLNSLTEKELIKEVKKLYDKFPDVKKYYQMELGDNSEKILAEYKARIEKEYFPKRGEGNGKSSVSRKVVTDFKKIAIHQKDVAELMLYRTEMMLRYANYCGGIEEPRYSSLMGSFADACEIIGDEQLTSYFKVHCEELLKYAFGFRKQVYDSLSGIYLRYTGDEIEINEST